MSMQAKKEMDTLLEIQSKLSKFDEQQATPNIRKELCNYIKKLTTDFGMVREDKDNSVRLWISKYHKDCGMSSDIEIYGVGGTINICDDSLWRTIKGLDEMVRGE